MAVYLGSNKVEMLGGQPIVMDGIDTSDATATASDMAEGVTAYVDGKQVTGNVPVSTVGYSIDCQGIGEGGKGTASHFFFPWAKLESDILLRSNSTVEINIPSSTFGNVTAEDVVKGKTFFSPEDGYVVTGTHECEEGLDTSDATAIESDIASGKTAYVDGVKITGTATYVSVFTGSSTEPSNSTGVDGDIYLVV